MGDEGGAFDLSLGNEEPIEGISVMPREFLDPCGMLEIDPDRSSSDRHLPAPRSAHPGERPRGRLKHIEATTFGPPSG